MYDLKRKGLSSVVQVSLLALLSVVALSLVWGYVKDLSNNLDNQLSPTIDCISQKSRVIDACINQQGKIEVNLDLYPGEEMELIDLNFKGQSFSCGSSCQSCGLEESSGKNTIYLSPQYQVLEQDKLATSINGCNPKILTLNQC